MTKQPCKHASRRFGLFSRANEVVRVLGRTVPVGTIALAATLAISTVSNDAKNAVERLDGDVSAVVSSAPGTDPGRKR